MTCTDERQSHERRMPKLRRENLLGRHPQRQEHADGLRTFRRWNVHPRRQRTRQEPARSFRARVRSDQRAATLRVSLLDMSRCYLVAKGDREMTSPYDDLSVKRGLAKMTRDASPVGSGCRSQTGIRPSARSACRSSATAIARHTSRPPTKVLTCNPRPIVFRQKNLLGGDDSVCNTCGRVQR